MAEESTENQGEGNPKAAERFNRAEQEFVRSPAGREAIAKGPQVRPEEEAGLEQAEQVARERAKGPTPPG